MKKPLLSVIIPTHKRASFLVRAIESALDAAPDKNVEVIVVPNGGGDEWQEVALKFINEYRVSWHPINVPNANMARNHGLNISKGCYIRFLDDDDYFYPEAAFQLMALKKHGGMVSQGGVSVVANDGYLIGEKTPNKECDYATSMLRVDRLTLNCSLVFKNDKSKLTKWDEKRKISQDVDWALSLCHKNEFSILFYEKNVAAWVQHSGDRISRKKEIFDHHKEWDLLITKTIEHLRERNAVSLKRLDVAVESLWLYSHKSFYHDPIYWSKRMVYLKGLKKKSRPDNIFFNCKLIKNIDPLILEWLLLPLRLLDFYRRKLMKKINK